MMQYSVRTFVGRNDTLMQRYMNEMAVQGFGLHVLLETGVKDPLYTIVMHRYVPEPAGLSKKE